MTDSENVDFILDEFLPYKLNVVAQLISKSFAKTYTEAFNISVPEWRVIAHLSQQQDISIREISEHAFMPKAKVTRAVQTLVARNLVKKVTDSGDRRLVSLQLTRQFWMSGMSLRHNCPRVLNCLMPAKYQVLILTKQLASLPCLALISGWMALRI